MYLLIHRSGHWETMNVGLIPLCLENPVGLLQRRSSTRPLHKGAIPTLTSLGGPESIPDYHLGTLHSSAMETRTYSQLSESLALQDFLRSPGWYTAECTRLNSPHQGCLDSRRRRYVLVSTFLTGLFCWCPQASSGAAR